MTGKIMERRVFDSNKIWFPCSLLLGQLQTALKNKPRYSHNSLAHHARNGTPTVQQQEQIHTL